MIMSLDVETHGTNPRTPPEIRSEGRPLIQLIVSLDKYEGQGQWVNLKELNGSTVSIHFKFFFFSKVLKWKIGLFKYYNSNKVNFSYLLFPWELSISAKLNFFSLEVIKIASYNFLKISVLIVNLCPLFLLLCICIFFPWSS